MAAIPTFITHYHRPDRAPFLNLSDLDEAELAAVLEGLPADGSSRRFGPRYTARRRASEELLRTRFVERGGSLERRTPHYFVLGESPWFRDLYDDAREVRLSLDTLPPGQVGFTIPDSLTSMGLLPEFGIEVTPRAHHGQVFLIEELPQVAQRHGLPQSPPPDDYAGHQVEDFEHYVEVQVWTDAVLP